MATLDQAAEGPRMTFGFGKSLKRNRKWALIASYVCLILFVIFFLFPPYYMLLTSFSNRGFNAAERWANRGVRRA